mmetsp:Transcript_55190/g.63134  ORF Transcript_55190/g.63134 Transcript_55190/m.63134 type:complete len:392 (+) Transcript_55190:41-1216(+)
MATSNSSKYQEPNLRQDMLWKQRASHEDQGLFESHKRSVKFGLLPDSSQTPRLHDRHRHEMVPIKHAGKEVFIDTLLEDPVRHQKRADMYFNCFTSNSRTKFNQRIFNVSPDTKRYKREGLDLSHPESNYGRRIENPTSKRYKITHKASTKSSNFTSESQKLPLNGRPNLDDGMSVPSGYSAFTSQFKEMSENCSTNRLPKISPRFNTDAITSSRQLRETRSPRLSRAKLLHDIIQKDEWSLHHTSHSPTNGEQRIKSPKENNSRSPTRALNSPLISRNASIILRQNGTSMGGVSPGGSVKSNLVRDKTFSRAVQNSLELAPNSVRHDASFPKFSTQSVHTSQDLLDSGNNIWAKYAQKYRDESSSFVGTTKSTFKQQQPRKFEQRGFGIY